MGAGFIGRRKRSYFFGSAADAENQKGGYGAAGAVYLRRRDFLCGNCLAFACKNVDFIYNREEVSLRQLVLGGSWILRRLCADGKEGACILRGCFLRSGYKSYGIVGLKVEDLDVFSGFSEKMTA